MVKRPASEWFAIILIGVLGLTIWGGVAFVAVTLLIRSMAN